MNGQVMIKGDSVEVLTCGNVNGKMEEKWQSGVVLDIDETRKHKPYKVSYIWNYKTSWGWFLRSKVRKTV